MPRWVVSQSAAAGHPTTRGGETAIPIEQGIAPANRMPQAPDDYAEKLVKYVPAEVLAFALPAAALNSGSDSWLKAIIAAGLVTAPLYLFATARTKPASQRPPGLFYLLSALAFVPWILGASPAVAGMTGWGQGRTTTILLFAVLVIPLLDQLFDTPPNSG